MMLDSVHNLFIISSSFVVLLCLRAYINAWKAPINRIPAIGYSGVFTSYITAVQSVSKSQQMINEGLAKYAGAPFRIPMMGNWIVIASNPKFIDELRKAPGDALSFDEAAAELLQYEYTMDPVLKDHYQTASVRSPMTKSLGERFPDVFDEIKVATSELVPLKDDWTPIPAFDTVMRIVVRTSNRLFVGLPYCRDPDYCKLNEETTMQVATAGTIIGMFPDFLRPLVARFVADPEGPISRGTRQLGSMIKERLEMEEKHGKEWVDRPNDMISWLLEYAQPQHRNVRDIVLRVLVLNFGAIHTTTLALTHALYDLIAHPEYIAPLREEVESVIAAEGWTRNALRSMHKIDSFIRESQRISGGIVVLLRKAVKDFTFSDGTVVPAGCFVAASPHSAHFNPENYEAPETFKGFRHSDNRAGAGEGQKHQAATSSSEWLNFGLGQNSCPGRFFAVNEMTSILAHILLNYDITTADGQRPKDVWFGMLRMPNPKANVLFRKRQT